MNKAKNILLTWDAFNNGFAVTAETIRLLSNNSINIDELYYFQNDSLQSANKAEIDVFYKNKTLGDCIKTIEDEKIKERLRLCDNITESLPYLPKFKNQFLAINGVTDYQSIYDSLSIFIKDHFYGLENTTIHINVSPGTPQMHVVWLMLNSSGFLPAYTTLWSTQWVRKTQKTTLERIKFKPQAYLSDVLHSNFTKSKTVVINPNETKSESRQQAEEKLTLFTKIPKAPIMILGERGVGKSTYVRNIVKKKDEPYFELACGTFSEELMRAELFGYEEGAFTGASKKKAGILYHLQNGGILFLDEIHDLSTPLQRMLIQVLQNGEYYPIGADAPITTKFRLITASNKELEELYNKNLSLDFFDRIARFIVEIPPLRKCKEDIELYWSGVWKEISNFDSAPSLIWNNQLANFIYTKDLKGNFRDLQRLATHVILYFLDTKDKKRAVTLAIRDYQNYEAKITQQYSDSYFNRDMSHNEIIAHFEKDLAEWAIKEYETKKEACTTLNISLSKLNKDLKHDRLTRAKTI